MFVHIHTFEKTGLSGLHDLKESRSSDDLDSMITLVYLVSVLVNSWSKEREENYGTPV